MGAWTRTNHQIGCPSWGGATPVSPPGWFAMFARSSRAGCGSRSGLRNLRGHRFPRAIRFLRAPSACEQGSLGPGLHVMRWTSSPAETLSRSERPTRAPAWTDKRVLVDPSHATSQAFLDGAPGSAQLVQRTNSPWFSVQEQSSNSARHIPAIVICGAVARETSSRVYDVSFPAGDADPARYRSDGLPADFAFARCASQITQDAGSAAPRHFPGPPQFDRAAADWFIARCRRHRRLGRWRRSPRIAAELARTDDGPDSNRGARLIDSWISGNDGSILSLRLTRR